MDIKYYYMLDGDKYVTNFVVDGVQFNKRIAIRELNCNNNFNHLLKNKELIIQGDDVKVINTKTILYFVEVGGEIVRDDGLDEETGRNHTVSIIYDGEYRKISLVEFKKILGCCYDATNVYAAFLAAEKHKVAFRKIKKAATTKK